MVIRVRKRIEGETTYRVESAFEYEDDRSYLSGKAFRDVYALMVNLMREDSTITAMKAELAMGFNDAPVFGCIRDDVFDYVDVVTWDNHGHEYLVRTIIL